jgi:hypothetical protein
MANGRRNLTPDQYHLLRGRRYNRAKKKQGTNNQYVQAKSEKCQSDTFHYDDTATTLAEQYGLLRGRRYNRAKKAQGAPQGNDNAAKQKSQSATFVSDTASQLAEQYGEEGSWWGPSKRRRFKFAKCELENCR